MHVETPNTSKCKAWGGSTDNWSSIYELHYTSEQVYTRKTNSARSFQHCRIEAALLDDSIEPTESELWRKTKGALLPHAHDTQTDEVSKWWCR